MNDRNKFWNEFWYQVAVTMFRWLVFILFFFAILEAVIPHFVSYFIDLNLIISAVAVSGILLMIVHELPREKFLRPRQRAAATPQRLSILALIASLVGVLVYVQTRPLGRIALPFGLAGFMLTGMLVNVMTAGPDDEKGTPEE